MAELSATEAVSVGKQTAAVYTPRIIHVDVESVHTLMGVASHEAWKTMAKKYKSIRQKGKAGEMHRLAGDYMKAWCWELVAGQIT